MRVTTALRMLPLVVVPARPYSTVTDFARFRGLSTSVPRAHAVVGQQLQRHHVQQRREFAVVLGHADHVDAFPLSMCVSPSASTYSTPPRARTSCMLLLSFSSSWSLGATVTTGMVLVTSASGPCLSSPAA